MKNLIFLVTAMLAIAAVQTAGAAQVSSSSAFNMNDTVFAEEGKKDGKKKDGEEEPDCE